MNTTSAPARRVMTSLAITHDGPANSIHFSGDIALADIEVIADPVLRESLLECCVPGQSMSRLALTLAALLKMDETKRRKEKPT